jgi:hypothetical protein
MERLSSRSSCRDSKPEYECIALALDQGGAKVQAVSRRILTAAARVQFQVRSYGIYGGQSSSAAGFVRVLRFQFHRLLHTYHLSSKASTTSRRMANVPSVLSLNPPQEIKTKSLVHPFRLEFY